MSTPVVIPAKAGIQTALRSAILDSRLRGNDGTEFAVEAQKLLGISLEGSVG